MLTGDKKETAVNLAQAAGLIKSTGMPNTIREYSLAVKHRSIDKISCISGSNRVGPSDKMLDLSDAGEEELSRAVSSEFKRLIEDNVDLPFLVDSLVVDGRALQVGGHTLHFCATGVG